jgi:hypothetical protein
VLGWNYNNGGVKLNPMWSRAHLKALPSLMQEGLAGWKLVIIPPRRLKKSVEGVLPNMVKAETIMSSYFATIQKEASIHSIIAACVQINPSSSKTARFLEKINLLNRYLPKESTLAESNVQSLLSETKKIMEAYNGNPDFTKTIQVIRAWLMLDDSLVKQSVKFEERLYKFFESHPLLVDSLNENTLSMMDEGEIEKHIVGYINMVSSSNIKK